MLRGRSAPWFAALTLGACRVDDSPAAPVVPPEPSAPSTEAEIPGRLRLLGRVAGVDGFDILKEKDGTLTLVTLRRARDLLPASVELHVVGPRQVTRRWTLSLATGKGRPVGEMALTSVGDTDGDGFEDFAVGRVFVDKGLGRVRIDFHRGTNAAPDEHPESVFDIPVSGEPTGVTLVGPTDLAADGVADLLYAVRSRDDGPTSWFRLRSGATTVDPEPLVLGGQSPSAGPIPVAIGDEDGDGRDDLVLATAHRQGVAVHHGSAAGVHASPAWMSEPTESIEVVDVALVGGRVLALGRGPTGAEAFWASAATEITPAFSCGGPSAIAAGDLAGTPAAFVACEVGGTIAIGHLVGGDAMAPLAETQASGVALHLAARHGLVGLLVEPAGGGAGELWVFDDGRVQGGRSTVSPGR